MLVLDHSQSYLGFPSKRFYWCSSSNYIFASLPYVNTKYLKNFEEMRTYFTGEYDRVLIQVSGQPIVVDEDIVIPPKPVTELDRLAYVVYTIEDQSQVVPKSSYKFSPLQEVKRNEAFQGLSREKGFSLEGYQHFRPIQQKEKLAIAQRGEAVYNDAFLDEITQDLPKNSWSIVSDITESVAILRSLLWPGYYSYHRVNTPLFGGVYLGYGIRNHDLPFML